MIKIMRMNVKNNLMIMIWNGKKWKREISKAYFRLVPSSGNSTFIDLGVTDDVTGQVKVKMLHRSRMFYRMRYDID